MIGMHSCSHAVVDIVDLRDLRKSTRKKTPLMQNNLRILRNLREPSPPIP